MIRITRKGYLRRWKKFGAYLFERGMHHKRRPWSCIAARKSKGPHWHRRKMRRRYLRRMKRIEAMWARYRKPERLTEREVKIMQKKQFIEELYRRIKIMAPYYRMKQKVFACGAINVFEILKRRLAVKKWVFEKHVAEQRILISQLGFLKSTSTRAEINKTVNFIDTLTRMKMAGAINFKNALIQRKIINRRLAEKRKYFLNILVPLAEYYHKVKRLNNMTIPRYFSAVEKMVYQERDVQRNKTVEQRFLQVFGVSQMKYMELKAAAKEMGFYLRTRYFFTAGVSKVLNQLYYAKDIVLELLRDGHEILTDMFHLYNSYATMEDLQAKLKKVLEKRRLKVSYKRRQLEFEVELLLKRHKKRAKAKQCFATFIDIQLAKVDNKQKLADELRGIFKGTRFVMARAYIDGQTNETMKKVWAKYSGDMEDLLITAIRWDMRIGNTLLALEDENNRAIYFEEKEKFHADKILYVFYISVLYSIRASIFLIYYRRLRPFAYDVEAELLKKLFLVHEDQRLFEIAVRNYFKLTKRTPAYRRGMLGIHHKMFGGNRDKCMKLEFKFFRMFLAIRNSLMTNEERRHWHRLRRAREERKARARLISMAIVAKVSKEALRTFNFYKTKYNTICPLCCSAERMDVLRLIGEREDMIQHIPDVVASAQYYFLGAKKLHLTHDIEHCSEPAATFLLKLRILEDRRKMAALGRDPWTKF